MSHFIVIIIHYVIINHRIIQSANHIQIYFSVFLGLQWWWCL